VTSPSPECRYRPDLNALFFLQQAVQYHLPKGVTARWRIPHDDWQYLRSYPLGVALNPVQPPSTGLADEPWTLFGLPVVVTPPGEGFPELALVCDVRVDRA
jgi:hypothetical protein